MDERVEADRVAARIVLRVALVIVAVLVVVLAGLAGLARHYAITRPPETMAYPVPSRPRIDPAPQLEVNRYRAEQQARLESYGWVDREKGLAHIPVERAMVLYAEQAQKRGAR